jgi:hypothetical protein
MSVRQSDVQNKHSIYLYLDASRDEIETQYINKLIIRIKSFALKKIG